MKIDWVKKISSRKFWLCVTGFISALLVAFHVGQNDIAQVTAIISAFGTLIIYILSESAVDKASVSAVQKIENITTENQYSTLLNKDLNKEMEMKAGKENV